MLLSEVFDHLTHGELSQINLPGKTGVGIDSSVHNIIVSHLNVALIALYKRFPLKQASISVQMYTGINKYILLPKFAVNSGSSQPTKYILDTVDDPFTDNILKIERIITPDDIIDNTIQFNNVNSTLGITTVDYNTINVPVPVSTDIMTVHYRAAPSTIITAGLDPETTEIPITYALLEPLMYYIAYRAHSNRPSLDGNTDESAAYLQKFNVSVAMILNEGLVPTHNDNTVRELDSGWL